MLKTKEQVAAELTAKGFEVINDGDQVDGSRRIKMVDGVHCYLSAQEETDRDAEEAAHAVEKADYEANHKYKDDRAANYPPIGDQLDAIWKELNQRRLNGDDLVQDADDQLNAVLAVKAQYPKPA